MSLALLAARAAKNHRGGVPADPTLRGTFAKWNLEDAVGSTTAVDSSGNGHDLTNGATVTFGSASILPNGAGKSVLFPHVGGNYLQIPTGFITELTPPFSIVTFIRFVDVTATQQIFCSQTGGINWYVNGSKMICGVAGVSNNAGDTRALSNNTNYLLGLTCSATGDVTFYVNTSASSVFSGAMGTTNTGTDPARIGDYAGNTGVYPLSAYLQRYTLCNVELSATEISAFYAALS